MSDILKPIMDLPEISFIDGVSLAEMKKRFAQEWEEEYRAITGQPKTLAAADPVAILRDACALFMYQGFQHIDRAGKQNLLKYSYGAFLDHLGAAKKVERNPAAAAKTTLRFTLSAARYSAIGIPPGTRATTEDLIYFATDAYAEVPAGQMYIDVPATCLQKGALGNDLPPGSINLIVDPLGYVERVENVSQTEGGANIEDDASYAERIYLAPSSYSTAGPGDAYVYWIKTFSAAIGDVKVTSDQEAGTVNACLLLDDGSAPGEQFLEDLQVYLRDENIRPMTDLVTVSAPADVAYNIEVAYVINRSDMARAASIQAAVATAVDAYVLWQRKIGRDINPDELITRMKQAGAKRITLSSPAFTPVGSTEVATLGQKAVTYGGLEDD